MLLLVRLSPEIADDLFGVSVAGKFIVLGIFLAAAVLPMIAATRGSKWWLIVAAASPVILIDFCVHSVGPRR